MPRYRSKPKVIEAIEFTGDRTKDEELISCNGVQIQYNRYDNSFEVYNKLHESWIGVKPGDMIRVDNPADIYPIDPETFEKTYEADPQVPTGGQMK